MGGSYLASYAWIPSPTRKLLTHESTTSKCSTGVAETQPSNVLETNLWDSALGALRGLAEAYLKVATGEDAQFVPHDNATPSPTRSPITL